MTSPRPGEEVAVPLTVEGTGEPGATSRYLPREIEVTDSMGAGRRGVEMAVGQLHKNLNPASGWVCCK